MKRNLMGMLVAASYCNAVLAEGGQPAAGGAVGMPAATAASENTAAVAVATEKQPPFDVVAQLGFDKDSPTTPVANKSFSFFFKKDDLGNKRPTFGMVLPVPTLVGLQAALANPDGKVAAYVLDLLADATYKQARVQVGDEVKPVNNQSELRPQELTLEFLANMPKAERTGGGIAKEVWEAFAKDYISIMPGVTGFNAEQIGNAAKIFVAKFQPVKTQKKIITFLKEQLALYTVNTKSLEEFEECVAFLDNKADTLLQADEAQLLANLGG